MQFGADHMETAQFLALVADLDVCSAPSHIGSDGYAPKLPGMRDDFGLAFHMVGIQHQVGNSPGAQVV